MSKVVQVSEPSPGVKVITLDRPDAANALNTAMGEELLALWGELSKDGSVRVAVLTGAGRFFCAGADLKERDGMSDRAWSDQHVMFEAMIRAQLSCPFPVIAAVNGAAMGGGCEMALACDFAWASQTARLGLPEVGLGIIPGLGGTQYIVRAAGERRASELLMSGLPIDAGQALEFGLVNRITPPDELIPQVLERARVIAGKAPLSVRALKKVVRGGAALPLDKAMALELVEYNRLFKTKDRREGVAAFNQKRTAVFKGE
jgi:enoyl-CoA hydratase